MHTQKYYDIVAVLDDGRRIELRRVRSYDDAQRIVYGLKKSGIYPGHAYNLVIEEVRVVKH